MVPNRHSAKNKNRSINVLLVLLKSYDNDTLMMIA